MILFYFILSLENEIIPVEVKSQIKLKKRIFEFLNVYKPKRALVFTEKEFKITKIRKNNRRLCADAFYMIYHFLAISSFDFFKYFSFNVVSTFIS